MVIKNKTIQLFTLLFLGGVCILYGREASISGLTPQRMKAACYLDGISVPSPDEMLEAINKVSHPNWAMLSHGGVAPVTTHRAQLALAIGLLFTNGYLALEAEDGQQVKNIGRDIRALSKALGVSITQNMVSGDNNLSEPSDYGERDSFRKKLEATEHEVKKIMIEQQDRNLVALTSAGAWLRGLEVASAIVVNNYSPEGAALLAQPALIRHLALDLERLSPKLENDPLVIQVKETLLDIATLLEQECHHLSKEVFSQVQAKASHMVEVIETPPLANNSL
jgi:hypothetical protein